MYRFDETGWPVVRIEAAGDTSLAGESEVQRYTRRVSCQNDMYRRFWRERARRWKVGSEQTTTGGEREQCKTGGAE